MSNLPRQSHLRKSQWYCWKELSALPTFSPSPPAQVLNLFPFLALPFASFVTFDKLSLLCVSIFSSWKEYNNSTYPIMLLWLLNDYACVWVCEDAHTYKYMYIHIYVFIYIYVLIVVVYFCVTKWPVQGEWIPLHLCIAWLLSHIGHCGALPLSETLLLF